MSNYKISEDIQDLVASIQGACPDCNCEDNCECEETFAESLLGIDSAKVHTVWLTVGGPTKYIELKEQNSEFTSAVLFSSYSGEMQRLSFYGDEEDAVFDYFNYLLE